MAVACHRHWVHRQLTDDEGDVGLTVGIAIHAFQSISTTPAQNVVYAEQQFTLFCGGLRKGGGARGGARGVAVNMRVSCQNMCGVEMGVAKRRRGYRTWVKGRDIMGMGALYLQGLSMEKGLMNGR